MAVTRQITGHTLLSGVLELSASLPCCCFDYHLLSTYYVQFYGLYTDQFHYVTESLQQYVKVQ